VILDKGERNPIDPNSPRYTGNDPAAKDAFRQSQRNWQRLTAKLDALSFLRYGLLLADFVKDQNWILLKPCKSHSDPTPTGAPDVKCRVLTHRNCRPIWLDAATNESIFAYVEISDQELSDEGAIVVYGGMVISPDTFGMEVSSSQVSDGEELVDGIKMLVFEDPAPWDIWLVSRDQSEERQANIRLSVKEVANVDPLTLAFDSANCAITYTTRTDLILNPL